jgi:hypothetical protein
VAGSTNYSAQDIDTARTAIASEAGKFGAVGDDVPADVAAGMFGTLGNSGALATAVGALCHALRGEFTAAETLIGSIERAMDSMQSNTGDAETDNKQSFQVKQV